MYARRLCRSVVDFVADDAVPRRRPFTSRCVDATRGWSLFRFRGRSDRGECRESATRRDAPSDATIASTASTHSNPAQEDDYSVATRWYRAPELLKRLQTRRGTAVDLWAAGVVLHVLLLGALPYTEKQSHPPQPSLF